MKFALIPVVLLTAVITVPALSDQQTAATTAPGPVQSAVTIGKPATPAVTRVAFVCIDPSKSAEAQLPGAMPCDPNALALALKTRHETVKNSIGNVR
jgi:hypothetical protein